VVSAVLSFYSSELTSHAGVMVAFVVGLFTLVQSRPSIVEVGTVYSFDAAFLLVTWCAVYSLLRLVIYGSLSSVLTHASVNDWGEFTRLYGENLLDHARVTKFASWMMMKDKRFRRHLYKVWVHGGNKAGELMSVQPPMVIALIGTALFGGLIFGLYAWIVRAICACF